MKIDHFQRKYNKVRQNSVIGFKKLLSWKPKKEELKKKLIYLKCRVIKSLMHGNKSLLVFKMNTNKLLEIFLM